MDRSLLPGVLALAAVGWACGTLLGRGGGDASGRRALPVAVAVAALIALVTLPGQTVWKGAEAWRPGVAVGGVAALLAGWPALGAPRRALDRAGAVAAALFPATGAAAALLWLRPGPGDALAGAAAGPGRGLRNSGAVGYRVLTYRVLAGESSLRRELLSDDTYQSADRVVAVGRVEAPRTSP